MMYYEPLTQLSIQACHIPQQKRSSLQQVSSIYSLYILYNIVNKDRKYV